MTAVLPRWRIEERPLHHRLLPGWLGPLLGIPVGGAFGFQVWSDTSNGSLPLFLAIGATMGALAGSIVWFSDWYTIRRGLKRLEREQRGKLPPPSRGVTWPALAWVCCLMPIVGVIVSTIAYRKTQGAYSVFYTFVPAGASALVGVSWLLRQLA